MRNTLAGLVTLLLLAGALPGTALADDPAVARAREMLRRTQEALRQAQSDNADLLRAKTDAEEKLKAATQQIDAAKNGTKAAQASLNVKLKSAEGVQADLNHKLDDATTKLNATNAKLGETAKQLADRDAELAGVKHALEQSKTANASCETKNLTLYGYAEAVLDKYRTKGVWASLSQKEPVFGLKQVDVENVVQEYQLKFDSQKINSQTNKQ
jgi:chromosome segregation ATPase